MPHTVAMPTSPMGDSTMSTTDTLSSLVDWLRGQAWSDFAQDLARAYDRKGTLSPAQVAAATRMRDKILARQADRPAHRELPPLEAGIYIRDDNVWRVKISRAGRPYAERLADPGDGRRKA